MNLENGMKVFTLAALSVGTTYFGYRYFWSSPNLHVQPSASASNSDIYIHQPASNVTTSARSPDNHIHQLAPSETTSARSPDDHIHHPEVTASLPTPACTPDVTVTPRPSDIENRIPNISSKTAEQIILAENRYFIGCNKFMDFNNLNSDQISTLNNTLKNEGLTMEKCRRVKSFKDMLTELRDHGCFKSQNYSYFDKVNEILGTIGHLHSVDSSSGEHLLKLEKNVQVIIQENTREKKWDIVLLNAEEDNSIAGDFIRNTTTYVNNLQPPIKIASGDEYGSGGELQHYENVFDETLYIYVLITPNLKADSLKRYIGEANLVNSFREKDAIWRVVPVWVYRVSKKRPPFEYSGLVGISYYQYLEDNSDKACFTRVIQPQVAHKRCELC